MGSPAPDAASPGASGAPARLVVALVRGLRGLRGQVRVELLTDRPDERFVVGARLLVEGTGRALTIAEAAPVADGPGWWLRFEEVLDRGAAEALRGAYLEIEPPDEPREAGRWYWHELAGLAVRSTAGEPLGTIVEVYRAGGAEVFVVRGPRGELDVPAVRGIVTELAPERGLLEVDLDALQLDARPVEDEDYVRPRDRRPRRALPAPRTIGSAPSGAAGAPRSRRRAGPPGAGPGERGPGSGA